MRLVVQIGLYTNRKLARKRPTTRYLNVLEIEPRGERNKFRCEVLDNAILINVPLVVSSQHQ